MAESVKKGARITGSARSKLASELDTKLGEAKSATPGDGEDSAAPVSSRQAAADEPQPEVL